MYPTDFNGRPRGRTVCSKSYGSVDEPFRLSKCIALRDKVFRSSNSSKGSSRIPKKKNAETNGSQPQPVAAIGGDPHTNVDGDANFHAHSDNDAQTDSDDDKENRNRTTKKNVAATKKKDTKKQAATAKRSSDGTTRSDGITHTVGRTTTRATDLTTTVTPVACAESSKKRRTEKIVNYKDLSKDEIMNTEEDAELGEDANASPAPSTSALFSKQGSYRPIPPSKRRVSRSLISPSSLELPTGAVLSGVPSSSRSTAPPIGAATRDCTKELTHLLSHASTIPSSSNHGSIPGPKRDPRMARAVPARAKNPGLAPFEALKIGGFASSGSLEGTRPPNSSSQEGVGNAVRTSKPNSSTKSKPTPQTSENAIPIGLISSKKENEPSVANGNAPPKRSRRTTVTQAAAQPVIAALPLPGEDVSCRLEDANATPTPKYKSKQYQSLELLSTKDYPRDSHGIMQADPEGKLLDNPTNLASEHDGTLCMDELSQLNLDNVNEHQLDPPVFRWLEKKNLVKKCPRDVIFETRDTEHPSFNPKKPKNECVRLCQEDGFVPIDGSNVGYAVSTNGIVYHGVNYYAHVDGYLISSSRNWIRGTGKAREVIKNGTGDILAHRSKQSKTGCSHVYLVRTYRILRSYVHKLSGYRCCGLADESATGKLHHVRLGFIILGTWQGPRPLGYIQQHDDRRDDDSLTNSYWLDRKLNTTTEYKQPGREQLYCNSKLPINDAILDDEKVTWCKHPELDLQVDDGGTHVLDLKTMQLKRIRERVWKTCDWVDHKTCVGGKDVSYDRLALECKLGRLLGANETVDHKNGDRNNNAFSNLLPRFGLFQANNKRPARVSPDTNTQGVHMAGKKKYFAASFPIYLEEECTRSMVGCKCFSIKKLGKQGAYDAAVACRKKHVLSAGMVWE